MHDVLLSGYYGFGNAGDEAILEAAALAFQKRGLRVAALSHTPRHTAERLGIAAYERSGLSSVMNAIRNSRLILSGGGGLFQDTTSFRSLAYYLRIPFLAKLAGKKTMIFAQGIGPIRTFLGKRLTRIVGNRFIDRITVRDSASKETLISLGIKKDVQVTSDLAFLLPNPSKEEIESLKERYRLAARKRNLMGIVLRDWPSVLDHLPSLSRAVSALSEEKKITPVLISFQPGADDQILNVFHQHLTVEHILLRDALAPRELMAVMANLDFVLAMRYHALLFAARVGVPFLGIAYDDKVENLSGLLQAPFVRVEGLSAHEFPHSLEQAWAEKSSLQARLRASRAPRAPVTELTRKAEANIEIAMELMV